MVLTLDIFLLQDKLLNKLEENEPELATCQEEEVGAVYKLMYAWLGLAPVLFIRVNAAILQTICNYN